MSHIQRIIFQYTDGNAVLVRVRLKGLKSVNSVEIISAFCVMQNYPLSLTYLKYGRNAPLSRHIVFVRLEAYEVAILESLNICHINGESVSAMKNGALCLSKASVIFSSASVTCRNN